MIKQLINNILDKIGYKLIKSNRVPTSVNQQALLKDNPFNVLTIIIDALIKTEKNPFFIQVGANDGVRLDPVRDSVLKHRMSGMLIEPLPDIFAQLCENYKGQDQLTFESAALSNTDGTAILYRVRSDAPLADWVHGLASFNRQHIVNHLKKEVPDFDRYIIEERVPTLTVKSLLEKIKISDIFLLQIDTEGFDFEIIKMFFNAGILPKIINFEHKHIKIAERIECASLLSKFGYKFLYVADDTLAIHEKTIEIIK